MRLIRFRIILFLMAAAFVSLSACDATADSTDSAEGASGDRAEVLVEGLVFEPGSVTVEVGDAVTWINGDQVDHTVTSGTPGDQGVPGVDEATEPELDGNFDAPLKRAGSTFSFTFEEPGTYTYFCRVHAAMKAVVIVR